MATLDTGLLQKIRDPEGLLPRFTWIIDMPEWDPDVSKRNYNKFAKQALRQTLEKYHENKEGFEKHFRRDARQRYRHFPRSPGYKKWKQRHGSLIDLIKTGASQERMLSQRQITIGGSGANSDLRGRLRVWFKASMKGGQSGRFRNPDHPSAVTIQKMIIELQRFDESDPGRLAKWFAEAFMKLVGDWRKNRKRRRISGRGGSRRAAAA